MDFSNPYFTIILLTVLGMYALNTLAAILNLRALDPRLPEEFQDVYDAEKYRLSQEYARAEGRFDIIQQTFQLLFFLAFWLCGGFPWLDGIVRSLAAGEIVRGLVFFALYFAAQWILALPFSIYSTFVLEGKFGFNKTTPATFLADQFKSIVLNSLLLLPLLALLFWLFLTVPNAWLWAWLATTTFMLALSYLGPRYIMPLFNKFTPLPEGELKSAINDLAAKCSFPFREISVMDGSKRSARGNAFFAGMGANKKIALFDTLVEKHSTPELVAVLAHEIGHFKLKHIIKMMALSILQLAAMFFLFGLFLGNSTLFQAFGLTSTDGRIYLTFLFFLTLMGSVAQIISILMGMFSRKHEYEADAYASKATGGPSAMMSALKKLARDNLANLTPHPLSTFLHASHPPMIQRLQALKKLPS